MLFLNKDEIMKTNQKGFTLLELMVAIGVLAILVSMAAPNYRSFMEGQKVRSAVNEWQSAYYFAQREAMRLKQSVTFCGSTDGKDCADNANDFSNGWIIFYKDSENKNFILQDKAFKKDELSITANGNAFKKDGFKFMANGRLRSGTSTVTVKMKNGSDSRASGLLVNAAGRLTATKAK